MTETKDINSLPTIWRINTEDISLTIIKYTKENLTTKKPKPNRLLYGFAWPRNTIVINSRHVAPNKENEIYKPSKTNFVYLVPYKNNVLIVSTYHVDEAK